MVLNAETEVKYGVIYSDLRVKCFAWSNYVVS